MKEAESETDWRRIEGTESETILVNEWTLSVNETWMNKATATETANEMSSDELAQQLSDGNQFHSINQTEIDWKWNDWPHEGAKGATEFNQFTFIHWNGMN